MAQRRQRKLRIESVKREQPDLRQLARVLLAIVAQQTDEDESDHPTPPEAAA